MKKLICRPLSVLFVLIFMLFLTPHSISAQGYGTAVGGRFGNGFGLTLQQQVALNTTVEGILQKGSKAENATLYVLGEQHKNFLTHGFNVYVGGGLYKTWLVVDNNLKVQPANPWGICPIGGIEVTLGKLNISGDFKPNLKLGGDGTGFSWQSGISVRYVFAERYFRNDDWKFWKKWKK